MAHTAFPPARAVSRRHLLLSALALAACGGGGGGGAPGDDALQAQTLRQRASACTGPGFAPLSPPVVVDAPGADARVQVRAASAAGDGFAIAWLSRTPTDTLPSWRLQWQRFDAGGQPVAPPTDLPYAEDVAVPQNVAVLVQPSGRVVVAFAVTRPLDATNPFRVENAVLARVFQDGTALPGVWTIATQTVDQRSRPAFFGRPLLAGFDDGSLLAGWHLSGRVRPQLWVQRLDANGAAVDGVVTIDSLGALGVDTVPREQLLPLPGGGWIAATPWRTEFPDFREVTLVTAVGLRHAPDVPADLPWGSVLVRDERGIAVARPDGTGGAFLQQFNPGGHAAGRAAAVQLLPLDSVPLAAGDAALLGMAGNGLALQRIDPRGDPAGDPLGTSGSSSAIAGPTAAGGVVLAWTDDTAAGPRVLAQAFAPRCGG